MSFGAIVLHLDSLQRVLLIVRLIYYGCCGTHLALAFAHQVPYGG